MPVQNGKTYQQRSLIKLSSFLIIAFFFGCIPSLQQEWRKVSILPISAESHNRLNLLAQSAWTDLGTAKYQGQSLQPSPLEKSDIINMYYYLRSFISIQDLSGLFGIPIFILGPHADDSIVINHKSRFGHYHPEFPIRLRRYFIPALENPSFKSLTQSTYDNYLKRLARTFFVVYIKLNSNSEFFNKEVNRYHELCKEKRLDPFYLEKFVHFMNTGYTDSEDIEEAAKFKTFKDDEAYEEELVKQVVGFWMRRRIDKTDYQFYLGLADLISTYDRRFFEERLE